MDSTLIIYYLCVYVCVCVCITSFVATLIDSRLAAVMAYINVMKMYVTNVCVFALKPNILTEEKFIYIDSFYYEFL